MRRHEEWSGPPRPRVVDLTADGLDSTIASAPRSVVEPPPTLRHRMVPAGIRDWAVFQPNAPGRSELSRGEALMARQLLKGRGQYVAERVLVVVGARSAAMWTLLPGGIAGRCAGWWDLERVVARAVAPVGAPGPWPAASIVDLALHRVVAELRGIRCDVHSYRVLAALGA